MVEIKNFKFEELVRTSVCPISKNLPQSMEVVRNLVHSAECLELIRERSGHPITVSSGFRNDKVNHAVGGVANSYHKKGLAFDIVASGFSVTKYKTMPKEMNKLYEACLWFAETHPLMVHEIIPHDCYIHIAFCFDGSPKKYIVDKDSCEVVLW